MYVTSHVKSKVVSGHCFKDLVDETHGTLSFDSCLTVYARLFGMSENLDPWILWSIKFSELFLIEPRRFICKEDYR